jgi:tRNA pseudouridine55 synthase
MYKNYSFREGEILLFDKPKYWTSFDVVKKVRVLLNKYKGLKKLKVGHAGTLDPLATGLIIVCTGQATKKIPEIQEKEKEYMTTFKLGETTPSFDLETAVDHTFKTDHITKELVKQTLDGFIGNIQQIPPDFSAVKVNGQRAYKKARKGIEIKLQPKSIIIRSIELLTYENTFLKIKIQCSKGTYIRALARDIGKALNSGAHITELKRTAIGNYNVDKAFTVKQFESLMSFTQ